MNLLDRLLGHDAWTTRELLLRCRELTDAQLDREFEIGPRSVRATLRHIVRNVEVWTDLMAGGAVRVDGDVSVDALIKRLDLAAADLHLVAQEIARREAWDERWVDHLDDPPSHRTYGGAIAHVLTHGMHHRAQLLFMLRELGLDGLPEGDVLSWENQAAIPDPPGQKDAYMAMKTVLTASSSSEAQIVAGLLRAAGIETYIAGQLLQDEFGLSQAMLGLSAVEVSVREEDFLRARTEIEDARRRARDMDDADEE